MSSGTTPADGGPGSTPNQDASTGFAAGSVSISSRDIDVTEDGSQADIWAVSSGVRSTTVFSMMDVAQYFPHSLSRTSFNSEGLEMYLRRFLFTPRGATKK